MRLMLRYLRPSFGRMGIGFAIKITATVIELLLPYILSHILDNVVVLAQVRPILLWGAVMVLCSVAACLTNIWANRIASKVARDTTERIRHDLFHRTMYLSAKQIDDFTIPSLEARITSDTYNINRFLGAIQRIGVRAPFMLIGGLLITAILDYRLMLVLACTLPFIGIAVFTISKKSIPMYQENQNRVDAMTAVVREDTQGIRVIKALSKTDYEENRFDKVNQRLVDGEKAAGVLTGATNPLMNTFLNLGLVAVLLIGTLMVTKNVGTKPGTIIAFMQYFTLLSMAVMSISRIFVMYTKATASAKRIDEVLAQDEPIQQRTKEEFPDKQTENYLEFDHISFSYLGKRNNLESFSCALKEGQSLGIIGATGSGKTTVLSLLMRFYDVTEGAIRIQGRDIRTLSESELRNRLGVAMQNDFLFAGTIRENVAFNREISDEQIHAALKIAQAEEVVSAFPDGLDHPLDSKGANLSGGQRQRLLITRAVAGAPDLLILDDSSSALDYKTDSQLRTALKTVPAKVKIIIAQRVSSVMNCDCIIVLDHGKTLAMGTHDELMKTCPVYQEISESQMGGAILD